LFNGDWGISGLPNYFQGYAQCRKFDPGRPKGDDRKIRFPKVTPVRSEPSDLKKYEAEELPAKILPWIFYEFTMALGTWL